MDVPHAKAASSSPATFLADMEAEDADQVSDFVSKKLNPARVRPLAADMPVCLRGSYVFTPSVITWRTGFAWGAKLEPLSDYDGWFFYGSLAGHLTAHLRCGDLHSHGNQAFMADGAHFRSIEFSSGGSDIGICFDRAALVRRLAQLLEAPASAPLRFESRLDIGTGPGAALVTLASCINQQSVGSILNAAPLTSDRISELLIDLVLETLPHNYSERLKATPKLVAPRHIKRAMEAMKGHLDRPISLDDIAARCGVSLRALQYGFQRFVGQSPSEYLRTCRLEAARRDFEANPDVLIGEVAKRWGFTNIGRFNHQFKEQFGETASGFRGRLRREDPSTASGAEARKSLEFLRRSVSGRCESAAKAVRRDPKG